MAIKSFKELVVWQKAFVLTEKIYKLTAKLPPSEKFGLCDQMRRCAISITSNIAEGYERNGRAEYVHFLSMARGSSAELESQILLVQKLYGLDVETENNLLTEIQKMLRVMNQKLSKT